MKGLWGSIQHVGFAKLEELIHRRMHISQSLFIREAFNQERWVLGRPRCGVWHQVYLLICSDASEDSEFIYSYAQRPLKILSLFACKLKGPSKFWVYLLICLEASQDSEFTYLYTQRPLKILSLLTCTLRGLSRFWVYSLVRSEASWNSDCIYSYSQRPLEILSVFTHTLKGLST